MKPKVSPHFKEVSKEDWLVIAREFFRDRSADRREETVENGKVTKIVADTIIGGKLLARATYTYGHSKFEADTKELAALR